MPRSCRIEARTSPWRASDGEVRKNRSLSSTVDRAGEVAEGEIIGMPFGTATFASTAEVTPEQSAPTIATTPSAETRRSAAAVAAAESMQVESARTASSLRPSRKLPLSLISFSAISAESAICGVSDSIGPVKPKMIPIFTGSSCARAAPAPSAVSAVAVSNFFMRCSL